LAEEIRSIHADFLVELRGYEPMAIEAASAEDCLSTPQSPR
jgi:hypothetical protein